MPKTVVEARDLVRHFNDTVAVDGISFTVAEGEIFGFLGPNGAGKTTCINMLCTLLRPTSGSALIAGFDVVRDALRVRSNIGLVFQDTTLDDYLTASENLSFHAELYGVPAEICHDRLELVLSMVDLLDRKDHLVNTFSGGMKRRLEIARGLIHSPRVLFLDEPTGGLDPQTRSHIWKYIHELQEREAITIFLTTHYMDEAEHCNRIAIVDQGKLGVVDTPDALKAQVGKDRIELVVPDTEATILALKEKFGLKATISEDAVTFFVTGGEEFVPRLFAELGQTISSIRVARPTLDDVFMTHTGHTIRDAEAGAGDRLRSHSMRWRGRR